MTRKDSLNRIAVQIENMIKDYGRRTDILVSFTQPGEADLKQFSDWENKYFGLRPNEEYFMIYEKIDIEYHLLYVVNVTADSLLTAAQELMDLVASKF